MAIFDHTQRLSCSNCGNKTFTEESIYLYDKTSDNRIERHEVEKDKLIICAKCRTVLENKTFFKGATVL